MSLNYAPTVKGPRGKGPATKRAKRKREETAERQAKLERAR